MFKYQSDLWIKFFKLFKHKVRTWYFMDKRHAHPSTWGVKAIPVGIVKLKQMQWRGIVPRSVSNYKDLIVCTDLMGRALGIAYINSKASAQVIQVHKIHTAHAFKDVEIDSKILKAIALHFDRDVIYNVPADYQKLRELLMSTGSKLIGRSFESSKGRIINLGDRIFKNRINTRRIYA